MSSRGTQFSLIVASSLVGVLCPGLAQAQMMNPMTNTVVDARRGMPLFPAPSWTDGFFLQHTKVPDLGLYPRVSGFYGRDPLGVSSDPTTGQLNDRFILQPSVVLSILKWVDVGVSFPIVLYQDNSGFNVSRTALGDLRLLTKLRLPLPEKLPGLSLAVDVGFPTGSAESRIGAGQLSFFPRVAIDYLTLKKRLFIVGNIGGFLAGTGQSCGAVDPSQPMMMMGSGGMMMNPMEMPCMTDAGKLVQGLGNHLYYGVGINVNISPDHGIKVVTELLGSFSSTASGSSSPLFWDIGLVRNKANKWTFGAMYGRGLNSGSPGHTVMATIGYSWEYKEPEAKEKPELNINVKVDMVPPPAPVPAAGGAAVPPPPPSAPPQGAPPPTAPPSAPPAAPPAKSAPPPPPPSAKPGEGKIDIEVPPDWWPEKKKD